MGITVCLEPEDCGFDSAQFSGVKEEPTRLREAIRESRVMHWHQVEESQNGVSSIVCRKRREVACGHASETAPANAPTPSSSPKVPSLQHPQS